MRELRVRAYIKPLKRYATGIDTIQFHKCCDVAGPGIWTVVTANEGIFEFDDIVIEQFTGLLDRNGKKIYEGDILETCCGKAEVYFDIELFMYRLYLKHGNTMPLVSKKSNRHLEYEVIGNVHEDKENKRR